MHRDWLPTIWLFFLCKQIGKPANTALRRPLLRGQGVKKAKKKAKSDAVRVLGKGFRGCVKSFNAKT